MNEDYREYQFENRLNAVIRHCKIGKVTRKWAEPVRRVLSLPGSSPYRTPSYPPLTGDPPFYQGWTS